MVRQKYNKIKTNYSDECQKNILIMFHYISNSFFLSSSSGKDWSYILIKVEDHLPPSIRKILYPFLVPERECLLTIYVRLVTIYVRRVYDAFEILLGVHKIVLLDWQKNLSACV